jgi:Ca2+-binding RTX toxin-like protein
MNKFFKVAVIAVAAVAIGGLWCVPAAAAAGLDTVMPTGARQSLFGSFGLTFKPAQQRPDTSICLGERVTDVVQDGDAWSGSDEKEVVVVLGTGSVVAAEGGDDKICVYNSTVRGDYSGSQIFGGSGNDTVITYGGNNNIDTATGNDLVYLNGGEESVTAAEGDDHIWGLGATRMTAYGGSGNDLVVGSPGDDSINGGSDDDFILGNGGDDEITELYGNNKLYGGTGTDTINGGADYDLCHDFDEDTTFTYCEDIVQPPAPPLPEAG